jgi:hypothetical protein
LGGFTLFFFVFSPFLTGWLTDSCLPLPALFMPRKWGALPLAGSPVSGGLIPAQVFVLPCERSSVRYSEELQADLNHGLHPGYQSKKTAR